MSRVKGGFTTRRRRNKILKRAKGFRGGPGKLFRAATEAVDNALCYAYRDRRTKKREFRALWQTRIGAAARQHDLSYSKFMHGLKTAGVELDRKVLADLAMNNADDFAALVNVARAS